MNGVRKEKRHGFSVFVDAEGDALACLAQTDEAHDLVETLLPGVVWAAPDAFKQPTTLLDPETPEAVRAAEAAAFLELNVMQDKEALAKAATKLSKQKLKALRDAHERSDQLDEFAKLYCELAQEQWDAYRRRERDEKDRLVQRKPTTGGVAKLVWRQLGKSSRDQADNNRKAAMSPERLARLGLTDPFASDHS